MDWFWAMISTITTRMQHSIQAQNLDELEATITTLADVLHLFSTPWQDKRPPEPTGEPTGHEDDPGVD